MVLFSEIALLLDSAVQSAVWVIINGFVIFAFFLLFYFFVENP